MTLRTRNRLASCAKGVGRIANVKPPEPRAFASLRAAKFLETANAKPPETRASASRHLARQRNRKKPQRGTAGDPRVRVASSRAAKPFE